MNKPSRPYPLLLTLVLSCALLCFACGATAGANNADANIPAAAAHSDRIVAQLCAEEYDDYANYYTPDEYRLLYADYQGSFGGVGISMTNVDDYVVVYGVLADTPAAASTIQAGDQILSVDGVSVVGYDTNQAALLIRGEIGTEVTLRLRRSDGATYTETLTRAAITSQSVEGEFIEEAPETAYILIYDFTEQTANEFVAAFNSLLDQGPIANLIIDLRSNGGGSFYAAIDIANYFVPAGGTIVTEKSADGTNAYASNSGQLNSLNVVVLQNQWTASASEVLIGALRDEARATLIGATTFGKGITQGVVELSSGAALRYTRSRYYTPSGFDLHGVGIAPDISVEDPKGISAQAYFSIDPEQNPHLKAALNYLSKI